MNIDVRIIGKRFELNDAYIVSIASLIETGKDRTPATTRPKLTVLGNIDENLEDVIDDVEPEEPNAEEAAAVSIPTLPNPTSLEEGELAE